MLRLVILFLALLLTLPGYAQSGVDNCCQTGRACATEAEWVQGWHDYRNGQCAAPVAAASGVDNCCQTGRACAAEADWVQGWHDYRAGRCPASAPTVSSPAPSAPAATTTTAIDNCCQAGRACATQADWERGWFDYRAGQCGGTAPAPASSVAPQTSYHFSGRGRSETGIFTLTKGKWEFRPNLGRQADTFLHQVDSAGKIRRDGQCLSFPTNYHFLNQRAFGLRLSPYRHEFVVRGHCTVRLFIFGELDGGQVSGLNWSVSIRKTDGNI